MSSILRTALSSLFLVGTGFVVSYNMFLNPIQKFLILDKINEHFWIFEKILDTQSLNTEISSNNNKHFVNLSKILQSSEISFLESLADQQGIFNKKLFSETQQQQQQQQIRSIFEKIKQDANSG